MQKQIKALD